MTDRNPRPAGTPEPSREGRRADQKRRTQASGEGVRRPGEGPDEPIRFDQNEAAAPPRESQTPARGPALITGMFLPVIILFVIALVLIIFFVMR